MQGGHGGGVCSWYVWTGRLRVWLTFAASLRRQATVNAGGTATRGRGVLVGLGDQAAEPEVRVWGGGSRRGNGSKRAKQHTRDVEQRSTEQQLVEQRLRNVTSEEQLTEQQLVEQRLRNVTSRE
eukprot:scaffold4418_cov19-Tisochrysis_lutea.AAC.1